MANVGKTVLPINVMYVRAWHERTARAVAHAMMLLYLEKHGDRISVTKTL